MFDALVQRRLTREPVVYITGHREFWGLELDVTPAVLIPRPETELIIEEALAAMPARDTVRRIIDVGTGSGCLAVALAIEFPSATVVATDSSPAALDVAERNCVRHHVISQRLAGSHRSSGWISGPADLIVSNPPYVPDEDAPRLQLEVARYEPASALFAGADGLDVIRRLFAAACSRLAKDGRLVVEFGLGQEADLREASGRAGWTVDHVRRDLQSIPRVAVLRR